MATRGPLPLLLTVSLVFASFGCPLDIDALRIAAARDAGVDAAVTEPAPDAAIDDAGHEVTPDADARVDPVPECGVIGTPCCMPGNSCDVGACLRGRCTAYAGTYARGCDGSCSERNPYTAGCTCALGFSAFDVEIGGDALDCNSSWTLCATPTTDRSNFAGAYTMLPDAECEPTCTGSGNGVADCSCPAGARMVLVSWEEGCGSAEMGVCLRDAAPVVDLEVHVRDPDGGCAYPNPATGMCECSEGMLEQRTALSGYAVTTCSP